MFLAKPAEDAPFFCGKKFNFPQQCFQLLIYLFPFGDKGFDLWSQLPAPPLNVPKPPEAGTLAILPPGLVVVYPFAG